MGKYTNEDIARIIKTNPNRDRLDKARAQRQLLLKHVQGIGSKESLVKLDWFESDDVYNAKKKVAVSNKDLFARLLNEEKQVFTARGGSVRFNLKDSEEKKINQKLDNVRYGISLHKWVEKIAYEARKVDPEGVIFVEIEPGKEGATELNSYPTYKSTECIHDNEPNGRQLEYICFRISKHEYKQYGIVDSEEQHSNSMTTNAYKYFRWVDDAQDVIMKMEGDNVTPATNVTEKNPIANVWGRVPGFIISDEIRFDDPKCFNSPLDEIIELAETYLDGRADRNLQKKYHGFAKAIEPLLKCMNCAGTGTVAALPCPECSKPGMDKGTGYKMRTKVSDVFKFPIEILKDVPGFDFNKFFGYATPPIETWDKQDKSLEDIEGLIYYTYWSTVNVQATGFNGKNAEETATKTLTNLQPKYAVLNNTADWAEDTENKIADLIGQYVYPSQWSSSNIRYGRNYVLETPEDLANAYYDMCAKGAPDSIKDEALERYIRALYQNNPMQQAKYIKLMKIIPFPHDKADTLENSVYVPKIDKLMKRFGGEWEDSVNDMYIIAPENTIEKLRAELKEYAAKKMAELEPVEPKTIV